MENILTEKEVAEVEKFCSNEVMKEAVRKVLLAGIYDNGTLKPGQKAEPSKNFALFEMFNHINAGVPINYEEMGRVVYGKAHGIKLLEVAFAELDKMKVEKPKDKPIKSNIAL